jgi:glycine dehydrogenase subunit 1
MDFIGDRINEGTSAVLIQHPNFYGCLEDVHEISRLAHSVGALLVVCIDPVSLGVLAAPGDYDADIAVGEGQPLGIPGSFGGPFLGIFSTKMDYVRKMPGRLVGRTADADGREGFVLTLQTREQHIRRERATSNICTNEALCALAASVYMALMGKQGIVDVAKLCAEKSHYLAERISECDGYGLPFSAPFFKEFVVECPGKPEALVTTLMSKGYIPGVPLGMFDEELSSKLLVAVTEKRTRAEMDFLVSLLKEAR